MSRPKKSSSGKPVRTSRAVGPARAIPVTTVKHRDKRANIPTEELRDFVADEEKNPFAFHAKHDHIDPPPPVSVGVV